MGTAHMACDPKGGAIMAQEVKIILKGDALEVVEKETKAGRRASLNLQGNQNLLIELEGGEQKWFKLGQYLIVPGRRELTFGE